MSEQQWLRQFVERSIFSRHRAGGGTSTNGNDIGAVNGTLSDFDHFELVEAEARHISLRRLSLSGGRHVQSFRCRFCPCCLGLHAVDCARKYQFCSAAARDIYQAGGVTQLTERSVGVGDGGSKETRHVEISDDSHVLCRRRKDDHADCALRKPDGF